MNDMIKALKDLTDDMKKLEVPTERKYIVSSDVFNKIKSTFPGIDDNDFIIVDSIK